MRVLVCGGRDYADGGSVFHTLETLRGISLIIEGGALGADEWAALWADTRGVKRMRFAADWGAHGRAAGPRRNQRMLDEGKPDLVVAFPGGKGTADMVRRARKAGIPVLGPAAPRPAE